MNINSLILDIQYIMKINLESHLLIDAFKQMGWKLPEIKKNKKNRKKSDL